MEKYSVRCQKYSVYEGLSYNKCYWTYVCTCAFSLQLHCTSWSRAESDFKKNTVSAKETVLIVIV